MSSETFTDDGHFVNGRWIEEETADEATSGEGTIDFDARIAELRTNISQVLGDVITLSKDIFESDEGRQHIESKVKKGGDDISTTLKNLGEEAAKLGEEAAKSFEQAFGKIKR